MKLLIRHEFKRIAFLLLFAILLGMLIDQLWLTIAIVLAIYLLWTLKQLQNLLRWLRRNPDATPPKSLGIWQRIFEEIYHIQRTNSSIRQRLNAALNRIRESTSALREGVILFDKKHHITWWNEASEKMFGFRKGRDEGQTITNLIRNPQFVEYIKKGMFDDTFLLTSPINPLQFIRVSIANFGDGEHLLFARDVTRLQNLEQTRQEFIGNVSHELRTPLTVITGYLETLLDHDDQLSAPTKRALNEMQKQAYRMNTLVQDLMLLSRLGTTNLDYASTPIDIATMLKSIKADAEALAPDLKHTITLSIETDARLQGNQQELHSALSNLVFNAVKYTPNNGEINMRWWQDNNGLHYSVQDNGIGIEEEHISRLTERFYRIDKSRSIETGGTGLGLAITKHVLIRHNGQLEIQSEFGKGSIFICHFPLNSESKTKSG